MTRMDVSLAGMANSAPIGLNGAYFYITSTVTKNKIVTPTVLSGKYSAIELPEEITITVRINANTGGIIKDDVYWTGIVTLTWKNDKYLTPSNLSSLLTSNDQPTNNSSYKPIFYAWDAMIPQKTQFGFRNSKTLYYGDNREISNIDSNRQYYISDINIPASIPSGINITLRKSDLSGSMRPQFATIAVATAEILLEVNLEPGAVGRITDSNMYLRVMNKQYWGWNVSNDGLQEIDSTDASNPTNVRYGKYSVEKDSRIIVDVTKDDKIRVSLVNFQNNNDSLQKSHYCSYYQGDGNYLSNGAIFPLLFFNTSANSQLGDDKVYFTCPTKILCNEAKFEIGAI